MSTRSSIAVKRADGTVLAVYCHFDGYLEGVGAALLAQHNSQEKAEALVGLGDLSICSARDGVVAYSRDKGEPFDDVRPHEYVSWDDYRGNVGKQIGDNGYRYVFDGEWRAWGESAGLTPDPLEVGKCITREASLPENRE